MLFNYRPEGAEPRQWEFVPDKLMVAEAEAIEKATHLTYAEFGAELVKGSMTARRALLWVLLKRTEPTLRHTQVDFPTGAVELEFEQSELKDMRRAVEDNADLSDAERAEYLKQLDRQILDQIESGEAKAPKASSNVDASSD